MVYEFIDKYNFGLGGMIWKFQYNSNLIDKDEKSLINHYSGCLPNILGYQR